MCTRQNFAQCACKYIIDHTEQSGNEVVFSLISLGGQGHLTPLLPFSVYWLKCIKQSINQSIIRLVLRHSTTALMAQDNVITTGKKDVSSIMI